MEVAGSCLQMRKRQPTCACLFPLRLIDHAMQQRGPFRDSHAFCEGNAELLDRRVLLFTTMASVLTALVFGLQVGTIGNRKFKRVASAL